MSRHLLKIRQYTTVCVNTFIQHGAAAAISEDQAPMEEMMDNLTVGIGYSYNVWKGLNVEPNYSMGLKEDEEGERASSFNLGLSYKF